MTRNFPLMFALVLFFAVSWVAAFVWVTTEAGVLTRMVFLAATAVVLAFSIENYQSLVDSFLQKK